MKSYLTEFIGTFFLVLTIGLAVLSGSPFAPLAVGVALTAMVYMGGHVSGAHYNPAVTLAVSMRGKLPASRIVPYWVAQGLGSVTAAVMVHVLTGQAPAPAPAPEVSGLQALTIEILYTFALALVVLNVATARQTAGNPYYGLAIGFTVMAGGFAATPISGGGFNPAVGLGMIVVAAAVGGGAIANLWLYLVGPLAGGALAALVFRIQHGRDAD